MRLRNKNAMNGWDAVLPKYPLRLYVGERFFRELSDPNGYNDRLAEKDGEERTCRTWNGKLIPIMFYHGGIKRFFKRVPAISMTSSEMRGHLIPTGTNDVLDAMNIPNLTFMLYNGKKKAKLIVFPCNMFEKEDERNGS